MASLKNAEKARKGRAHRERHQPAWRAELGELEKKSDYRKRATDFNAKRDTLKALKGKALERNPDEFHHHMIRSRLTAKGSHAELAEADPEETDPSHIALLASADLRYVTHKLNQERKKIEKLQASLHLSDPKATASAKPRHLVFVDSKEEAKSFTPASYLDTDERLLGRLGNRPRLTRLAKLDTDLFSKAELKAASKEKKKSYSELAKRLDREREMTVVLHKLHNKRNLAKSTGLRPRRVQKGGGKQAAVFRWEYERKK